ncbi:unnamed protein product, partial [Coregonus sp. 'balchen']
MEGGPKERKGKKVETKTRAPEAGKRGGGGEREKGEGERKGEREKDGGGKKRERGEGKGGQGREGLLCVERGGREVVLIGELCEVPPPPPSPCERAHCQNSAPCADRAGTALCQCLPGFEGVRCEKLVSVNFVNRDSYLQLAETVNDGHFHTVELVTFDRMVNLSVDGGAPTTLDSLGGVSPLSGEAPLYVGGMPEKISYSSLSLFQPLNSSSFHGCIRNLRGWYQDASPAGNCSASTESANRTVPRDPSATASLTGAGHTVISQSEEALLGEMCVRGVCVVQDVQSYRCECDEGWRATLCNQQGALTAPPVPAVPAEPCSVLLCQHGHCQLTEGGSAYCLCDTGYTGDTCDTVESACRGEAVRDFHRVHRGHTNCQTTRPFSWVECRGGCQGGGAAAGVACCAPLRVRRRRYTFECDDGTSFTQDVEKAVECGCKE